MTETILAISATVLLALLGWLIKALLAWGRTMGEVKSDIADLSKRTDSTAAEVAEIRKQMLSPADLQNAVLKLQIEVMRGTLGAGARATDIKP